MLLKVGTRVSYQAITNLAEELESITGTIMNVDQESTYPYLITWDNGRLLSGLFSRWDIHLLTLL